MQTIQTLLSENSPPKNQRKEFDKAFFCDFAAGVMLRLHTNKSQDFRFVIDEDNEKVIRLLWDYFFNPEDFDLQYNPRYYSGKGILLMGAPGSGKTNLMEIFIALWDFFYKNNSKSNFKKKSMRQILSSFKKGELPIISQMDNYFFDEIGLTEARNYKSYGNGIDVDGSVIETRYESFRNGYITHYTTNLSKEMMTGVDKNNNLIPAYDKLKFDQRVLSRLRESCNIISLNGKDRRQLAAPKRRSPEPEIDKEALAEILEKEMVEQIKKARGGGEMISDFLLEVWFDTARRNELVEVNTDLQWQELIESRKSILEKNAIGFQKRELKRKGLKTQFECFKENHQVRKPIKNNTFERDAIREAKANYLRKYYLEA
ncbi:hypothetical protein ACE193_21340 [Bernardetia sp. OM2101]|uniref:hypothetical protein n=1 Tax=Bernardetia sp. OM2101 TaxID=3344876 RepID=UPI0035CFF8D4